jgi:hypothetical protein
MRYFVQDRLSGIALRRRRKACEKINHPVEVPGQAGIYMIFRGLNFEHNKDIGQNSLLWVDTITPALPVSKVLPLHHQ